jgi:hypothetical protein
MEDRRNLIAKLKSNTPEPGDIENFPEEYQKISFRELSDDLDDARDTFASVLRKRINFRSQRSSKESSQRSSKRR